ncbi:pyridoxal-phosphate dependent enzyme [Methylocystis suflitae]|uniref:pyridoxal-phosphate dependent enzyme n=1 Tax=Methylocystis suflitae TaxID=2951405 RepID=UPI00210DA233|nr:pyridoxal-phosphate dependent enzyme [Methylocystis suflitae]MCQ4191604.1 pyridoxal-phosphate dependent enzyme [Methylocystis suflitae]
MASWLEDNSHSIERTPLVRLNRLTDGLPATLLAKIEGLNLGYSVKCRICASMIGDAEERGLLGPGKEIIEPTSGNTDIEQGYIAAARGIPLMLTMPKTMSHERRKGDEFVPGVLDLSLVDDIEQVSNDEAILFDMPSHLLIQTQTSRSSSAAHWHAQRRSVQAPHSKVAGFFE